MVGAVPVVEQWLKGKSSHCFLSPNPQASSRSTNLAGVRLTETQIGVRIFCEFNPCKYLSQNFSTARPPYPGSWLTLLSRPASWLMPFPGPHSCFQWFRLYLVFIHFRSFLFFTPPAAFRPGSWVTLTAMDWGDFVAATEYNLPLRCFEAWKRRIEGNLTTRIKKMGGQVGGFFVKWGVRTVCFK